MSSIDEIVEKKVKEEVERLFSEKSSQPQAKEQKKYLNVADVIELTGLAKQTIYQMSCNNTFPGRLKIGKKLLFEREIVQKWLDNQRIATREEANTNLLNS